MMVAESFLDQRTNGGVRRGSALCDLVARIGFEDVLVRVDCERVAEASETVPMKLTPEVRARALADVAAAGEAEPDGWYTAAALKVHLIGDTVATVEFAMGIER